MTDISNTALLVLLVLCLTFIVLLIFFVALCFPCCCPFFLIGCKKRKHLHMAVTNFLETQLDSTKESINQMPDLENQTGAQEQTNVDAASNVALNSFPMNSTNSTKPPAPSETTPDATESTTRDPVAPVVLSERINGSAVDESRDLDFKSVLEEYLEDANEEPVVQTIVANPSDPGNELVSQYDTFSRTVLLQVISEASRKPNEQLIREVSDPFLEKFIGIGEKVVVVKPFIGKTDREFPLLQTGDLLRIIRFNIVEATDSDATGSIKSIHIGSAKTKCKPVEANNVLEEQSDYQADEITIDKSDPNHCKIVCTGVLLDTYLEFNSNNNELKLKVKEEQENDDLAETEGFPYDLIKEFPLNIVSLETTVVKTALYGDDINSDTEY